MTRIEFQVEAVMRAFAQLAAGQRFLEPADEAKLEDLLTRVYVLAGKVFDGLP